MFSHQLDKNSNYHVEFSEYAENHFRKQFRKKYKGLIWCITENSIVQDLKRIAYHLQSTQQVDELWQKDQTWIFKYDFAIAKSGKSPKNSGNRCVCVLDDQQKIITIILIYAKTDLPKNMSETAFIKSQLKFIQ